MKLTAKKYIFTNLSHKMPKDFSFLVFESVSFAFAFLLLAFRLGTGVASSLATFVKSFKFAVGDTGTFDVLSQSVLRALLSGEL